MKRPARQVLMAGASDELAAEGGSSPGHSTFTSVLLDGLAGYADQNYDWIMTASDLANYVQPLVKGQTPFFSHLDGSKQ